MTTCTATSCGTGGWGGPLPGDPDNNSVLTATPAFGGIDVTWTYPATNPFAVAHTKLYRGVLADFNAAILVANVGGNTYYDKSSSAQSIQYYYWIQFVSINGTTGELIGPASAVAMPTIDRVIQDLTGKIDAGSLSQALKTDVDKITLNYQTLLDEITNRTADSTAFSALLVNVQADVSSAIAYINNEITARQAGDSALVSSVNTLAVLTETNLAAVEVTMQASINEVDQKAGALYTAKVTVNGLVGGFGIYNDGTTIEAGFDVDTFWVGKTGANKKKPFIVSGGQVYINQAVIANATIDVAKIDHATIQNLSSLNANLGYITAGNMRFNKPGDPSSTLIIDSATQTLQVWNAGVLRVKIGNLS